MAPRECIIESARVTDVTGFPYIAYGPQTDNRKSGYIGYTRRRKVISRAVDFDWRIA